MRRFSANYIYTNTGDPIRNGVVEVDDNGVIVDIINPLGNEKEYSSTEFHNGVIVPGFVNAHCHTELSHLKGKISRENGLAGFVNQIRNHRLEGLSTEEAPIIDAIDEMHRQGIVAIADICNTSDSFLAKRNGKIRFVNLVEVLGLDPENASNLIERAKALKGIIDQELLQESFITPHSVYTLSNELWQLLSADLTHSGIVSIHFAESKQEFDIIEESGGAIAENFIAWGLPTNSLPAGNHIDIVKKFISQSAQILFIHNTFLKECDAIELSMHFRNAHFVACPSSNLFIENTLPNIKMLADLGLSIAVGTDSLASTHTLSMLDQINVILNHFPSISFNESLAWATINGAKALRLEKEYGTIELGKKPGLNLISPFDFQNMRPKPMSKVRRLV
jgi:cytosine/adenosine deaminase-related metal-dependent hydrolase